MRLQAGRLHAPDPITAVKRELTIDNGLCGYGDVAVLTKFLRRDTEIHMASQLGLPVAFGLDCNRMQPPSAKTYLILPTTGLAGARTETMIARLDQKSRTTITRFGLKLAISLLIAMFMSDHRIVSIASWLSFYALFAAFSGLMLKEQIAEPSFTYWDEALWLIFVSMALQALPELA